MSFVVYRSSAGSGKTYTLVKQYLTIALSEPLPHRYRQVLAITFTNKAASEMKERVLGTLKSIATGNPEGTAAFMADELAENLGISLETLSQRAAVVLSSMLHNYSDLSISTIDKFTHRIIRTFAFDLKVPVNFEVEMDETRLISGTTDLLLEKAGRDELVTKILTEFSISRAEEDQYWDIEHEIQEYARLLLNEDTFQVIDSQGLPAPEEILAKRGKLIRSVRGFEEKVKAIGQKGVEIMRTAGVDPASLAGGSRGVGVFFTHLADFTKCIPSPTIQKTVEKDDWSASKTPAPEKALIESIRPQLAELFDQLYIVLEKYPEYILQQMIVRNLYGTALLSELSIALTEFKSTENILPISEFNRILSGIIKNEPAPFIYERLGERYRHFLIDEFQDTSKLQWHNLLPLLENGLSSGNLSMIVGDAKQSIYRWRGGEASQFINLPDVLASNDDPFTQDRGKVLELHYQEKLLGKNYRSCPAIVNFNNEFFEFNSATLPVNSSEVYRDLKQEAREGDDGYVNISFVGSDEMKKDECHELFLDKTVERIRYLTDKGVSEGSIAILVRTNSDGASVAARLNAEQIPVISQESLLIGSSAKVRLVFCLMQSLFQPFEQTHRIKIIAALKECKRLEEISWHELMDEKSFQGLLNRHKIPTGDRDQLTRLSLYDLAETTVRQLDLGKDPDPYLTAFLDQVHQFRKKADNSPTAFFKWWEETGRNRSINMPEGIRAVKILSIHKSKGLEFPYVILPFTNWFARNDAKPVWVKYTDEGEEKSYLVNFSKKLEEAGFAHLYEEESAKAILDELNLLYVAFTRPVKGLFILSSFAGKGSRIPGMLKGFIESKGTWSDTESEFHFGTEPTDETCEEESSAPLPEFTSSDWSKSIRISHISPEGWDPTHPLGETEKGILLHNLLSECQSISQAPEKASLMHCRPDLKEWLNEVALKLAKENKLAEVFDSGEKLMVERDILDMEGNLYRPDRVVIKNGKTYILDFKTGRKSDKHKKQIVTYAARLHEIGYSDIKKFLVYVNDNEVIQEVE